jgi:type II secretory pathway pseudopilin PulG
MTEKLEKQQHQGRPARNGQEGMTLIEVSVAAGVLLVVVVLLFGSVVDFARSSEVVSSKAAATAHANSVLEQIRQLDHEDLLSFRPQPMTGLGPTEIVEAACIDAAGNPVPLPIADPAIAARLPNPLEVRVAVTWRDKEGHEFRRQVSSLVER